MTEKKIIEGIKKIDSRSQKKIKEAVGMSLIELYFAATREEKTGLYNYRFFDKFLGIELERAKRKEDKFSIILIDIDYFKQVNDIHGHMKADELLLELAKVMLKTIRKADVLSRFGGEEFLMLLPGHGIKDAEKLSKRIQTNISKNRLLSKYEITVSGGMTEYKDKDTKKKILERADKALYHSKNNGRNKFTKK